VQLAATWEQAAGHSCGGSGPAGAAKRAQQVAQLQLPDAYAAGLRQCVWPGRAQVINTLWAALYHTSHFIDAERCGIFLVFSFLINTRSQGVGCGCSRECFAMQSQHQRSVCCEQQIFDAIVRCFQGSQGCWLATSLMSSYTHVSG